MSTKILTRADVAALVTLPDCIAVVEDAFRRFGLDQAARPGVLGVHVSDGGFHIKAAALDCPRPYFAAKLNANFPTNPARHGLPTIQGVLALCDATNGSLLALMDSAELTTLRTGAATAVAARYLANPGPSVVTVVGCGRQGRVSAQSLACVLDIAELRLFDSDDTRAASLAAELSSQVSCPVTAVSSLAGALPTSDVVVTCTPSRQPLLFEGAVRPGTFVAAVGADNPHKHEIDVSLMASSVIVADVVEQCASIGDLHHAIAAGRIHAGMVRAELGQVVAGTRPGRLDREEVIVFDSTGMALQDVATAALAFERAVHGGVGFDLSL